MHAFLGLVRYVADHLPNLAEHTRILNALTTKDADKHFPPWTQEHQVAFQAIKDLVVSPHCLVTIDHDNPGNNHVFLTCDASDFRTGAILSWGPSWETSRPVAFDSTPLHVLRNGVWNSLGFQSMYILTTVPYKVLLHNVISHGDKHVGKSTLPNLTSQSITSQATAMLGPMPCLVARMTLHQWLLSPQSSLTSR